MTSFALGDRLDRWLIKRGFRAGHPLATLRLIEARRRLAGVGGASRRAPQTGGSGLIPRQTGYHLFGPDAFAELPAVVAACEAVYSNHIEQAENVTAYGKRYFFNLMTADDLRQHPVLLDLALSPTVTAAVTGYLRHRPRLHSLGVFYSSVTDTIDGSQMFHVDGDCLAQVKCFVNIWNTGGDSGAFTFLPSRATSSSLRHRGLLKTMNDADVFREVSPEQLVVASGPPGSGCMVDTSRCLHQGSRARERPRLVFQFQYVSRPDALIARDLVKPKPGGNFVVTRRSIAGMTPANPDWEAYVDE